MMVTLIVAVLFASSLSLLSNPSSEILPTPAPARTAYTSHANITINDNYGFQPANWTANGISGGSGIPSDPYVINGWDINGAGHQYAIYIGNTTKHFMLSNCSGKNATLAGICLNNVTNSKVINNDCSNNGMEGIVIGYSDGNNLIADNLCANSNYGIIVALSSNCMITDNLCENNSISIGFVSSCNNTAFNNTCRNDSYGWGIGIYLDPYSSDNTIVGNNCSSNIDGILLDPYSCNNTISSNNCSSNNHTGIWLYTSSNNTISNNTCSNNENGIYLVSSNDNIISNNTCSSNSQIGIGLGSSSSNTISSNTCSYNTGDGIYLYSSSGNALNNNTCSDNGNKGIWIYWSSNNNILSENNCSRNSQYGICIERSMFNMVVNNNCSNNIQYGLDILDVTSILNRVWNNTFIGNNGAGSVYDINHIQAYDGGAGNRWNSSGTPHGYGNYWSDWQGRDFNMDGIQDAPYNITGFLGAKDFYPLATFAPPIPEFSELIIPIVGLMLIALIFGRTRKKP